MICGDIYLIKMKHVCCSVLNTWIKSDEELYHSLNVSTLSCFQEYQSFGWWVGEKNGAIGIVPKDYLMELYAL